MANLPNQPMFSAQKRLLVFVLTIFSHFVFSQTNWQDTFSDSNHTVNPTWIGDTGSFIVNSNKKLQLDAAPVTSTNIISTTSTASLDAAWEFLVELDFNPSTNNYALVHLMSTNAPSLPGSAGYFVRIGGSSEDRISLFRNDGSNQTLLIESKAGIIDASSVKARIKVERNTNHEWTLLADTAGGNTFKSIGTAIDSTFKTAAFFGLECIYTSTRSNKFFFDDIKVYGQAFVDQKPPSLAATTFNSAQEISLLFSEPIDSSSSLDPLNFKVDQGTNPITNLHWSAQTPNRIDLTVQFRFMNEQQINLFIEGIEDQFGNEMDDTTVTVSYFKPKYRDVVFNEILCDPDPTVQLPAIEYLEIANVSNHEIDLTNWKLVLENDTFLLPKTILDSNAYRLIVSSSNQGEYDSLHPIKLNLGNSWLKNSGESIQLLDEFDHVIDALHYLPSWHDNAAKAEGGWSLEQIDSRLACNDVFNWATSVSPNGGTPGKKNSLDQSGISLPNYFKAVAWIDEYVVKLSFTQGLNPKRLPELGASEEVDSIEFNPLHSNSILVHFTMPIQSETRIIINQSIGCLGEIRADTLWFSAPSPIEESDIRINEILFNAGNGNAEYIELWNTGNQTFLMSDLLIAKLTDSIPVETGTVIDEQTLLLPGSYLVLTENPTNVCASYSCGKPKTVLQIQKLPNLANDQGEIALMTKSLTYLEQIHYDEDWHHPSIYNAQNVSLERIHPALDGSDASAWHSASSASGYGTPGRQNSQFRSTATTNQQIWLENKTISPNNDGLNDVLIIHYNLPIGAAISADIFSVTGHHVQRLSNNGIASPEGILTWDGKTDDGSNLNTGVYIVLVEWFTSSGEKGTTKLNFAFQN